MIFTLSPSDSDHHTDESDYEQGRANNGRRQNAGRADRTGGNAGIYSAVVLEATRANFAVKSSLTFVSGYAKLYSYRGVSGGRAAAVTLSGA